MPELLRRQYKSGTRIGLQKCYAGQIGVRNIVNNGVYWTPEKADDYQIRLFVLRDIENPDILSPVVDSQVTIAGS